MSREWNDKLTRRLQNSIGLAEHLHDVKLLVTDLEDSEWTLVEIVVPSKLDTGWRVIGEYLVKPKNRPKTLRYRDERGWPE